MNLGHAYADRAESQHARDQASELAHTNMAALQHHQVRIDCLPPAARGLNRRQRLTESSKLYFYPQLSTGSLPCVGFACTPSFLAFRIWRYRPGQLPRTRCASLSCTKTSNSWRTSKPKQCESSGGAYVWTGRACPCQRMHVLCLMCCDLGPRLCAHAGRTCGIILRHCATMPTRRCPMRGRCKQVLSTWQ